MTVERIVEREGLEQVLRFIPKDQWGEAWMAIKDAENKGAEFEKTTKLQAYITRYLYFKVLDEKTKVSIINGNRQRVQRWILGKEDNIDTIENEYEIELLYIALSQKGITQELLNKIIIGEKITQREYRAMSEDSKRQYDNLRRGMWQELYSMG